MASVYLANQKKFDRQVAIKVLGEHGPLPNGFRQRFLDESRISAALTHPNIVRVYDVGEQGDLLYLVLEYIAGGNLNTRLEHGLRIIDIVDVVREISAALDYASQASEHGYVHRDVKPENILFRDDGSAVLSDFGIARVIDDNRTASKQGTVMGTPQYMSPEQAAGRVLDTRSDLYSLGVVLYQMLTGDVPYHGDTAVSVGVRHLQEPIPRLPSHLSSFQDVIDRTLAKKPDQRFQSGAEFTRSLTALRDRRALPNATVRSQVISTAEIRAAAGDSLLSTDRDAARTERDSRRQHRRMVRRTVLSVLLVGLIAGGGYLAVEHPDITERVLAWAGVGEDPGIQSAWQNAQSLHQDPNQGLLAIVAGYRRVLRLDPEHGEAESALDGLAEQWREAIKTALVQDDLTQADTKLRESTAAFPDDASLYQLSEQLSDRKHARELLASTQGLLRSHGLSDIPSATAAIQAYHEVLRLAPGNKAALEELNALAVHYAGLASEAADFGDVQTSIGYLDRASAADPDLPELAEVREKINRATTAQQTINALLQQASEYRAAAALINPPGENAAELYHRVLATDPDNAIAVQGLDEVMSQLLVNADQLLNQGDLVATHSLIERASAVGMEASALNEMRARLKEQELKIASVETLLASARELMEQGFITEPPDNNAVAVLREVERMDPGNGRAATLLTVAAERLASVAKEAFDAGLTEEAKQYLELALTVTPDVQQWRTLRDSWD
jgi:tetratricopeptide (TPR) repeat protein|tara:strand:+ start:4555 stop:6756 length:2202 start_codon:yes stop_codon:yes gene_type:complete